MTATRDRRSNADADAAPIPWDERPIAGGWRGVPWWAAVLVGFGLAGIGAIIDIETQDKLGLLFKACYFVGAVGAIAIVRRRNVFAPMVQPPLIIGVIVPAVVLLASGLPESSDTLATALAVGMPLIKGFPTMAITTVLVVVLGVVRIYRERDPNRPAKPATSGGLRGAVAGIFGKDSSDKTASTKTSTRREPEGARSAPPARSRQASKHEQEQRRRPPEERRKANPRDAGGKPAGSKDAGSKAPEGRTPPPGRERKPGGTPPQDRKGSQARKPPPERGQSPPPRGSGERGKQPPEGEPRRRRRPPEEQDRSGKQPAKQPPPKSSQPRRSAQAPRSSAPEQRERRQRREQDPPPRRQRPKRPWDGEDS